MKKSNFKWLWFVFLVQFGLNIHAQSVEPIYLIKQWKAQWIMVPETTPTGYGVYLFRKEFELISIPKSFPIHVSADNRYKLFVNEKLVSLGPARGDVLHWNYETVDLTPYLHKGHNIIAAQVWNEGKLHANANITLQTGFILQGGTDESQILNTNKTWKCVQDDSYAPINFEGRFPNKAYYAGPGEIINMQKHISNWQKQSFDDGKWNEAVEVAPRGWALIPSILPQMELKQERLEKCVKSEGVSVPMTFPAKKVSVTIPANTIATILLDQSHLTNAYPTLIFGGGKNGTIALGYAESLFEKLPFEKGNRNEVKNKIFDGRYDSIISNGGNNQRFTSLSWRTYRYLQIKIVTRDSPLIINDVYGTFTGYPFVMNAKLATDNAELQNMFSIGWRTARLCAMDTYMDCPYYEQLQYIADTRIQALVSLYNSGDDRMVRNALNQLDYSKQPNGLTLSRYPSTKKQIIPPFSLLYIGMLHDYMMYGKDNNFIKDKLIGARQILKYFKDFQHPDGSLYSLNGWKFTDWVDVEDWPIGVRKVGDDGYSALLDLQLLWAYQLAADMEQNIGSKEFAVLYRQNAEKLEKTIREKYWDSKRQLFADRSAKDLYSQHTNVLAILTGIVDGKEARSIGEKLLSDSTLAPASIYFKYYLHQALVKAGLGDGYINWLDKWRENLALGLTTWAETSDVKTARSDCHAWGSSPNIEFFRTILGIDSQAVGFSKVKIEPHLGNLKKVGGEMPHPNGKISVNYNEVNNHLNAEINFPSNTIGQFVWKGKSYTLKTGKNTFKI